MRRYSLGATEAYNLRLRKVLAGGVHYNFTAPWERDPIVFTHGKKSRLWDLDGNEYLDLNAKFGSMFVGHANERHNEALKRCLDSAIAVQHTPIDAEVCELILEHFIPSADKVRFGLSGTEVVLNAIRLARAYTGRDLFLRFQGHYHGNADSLLGGRTVSAEAPVPEEFEGDTRGTAGRARGSLAQCLLIPWNDVDRLEQTIARYGSRLAAVITEPINCNGGGIMPAPGYLQRMRDLCTRHGIVFILDEVITGFRVGLGGAQKLYGLDPDLTVTGKALSGGGLPVGLLAGKRELMELYEKRIVAHGGTYNGYTLGMVATRAAIELLVEGDGECYRRVARAGAKLAEIVTRAGSEAGLPLVVQGPPSALSAHVSARPLDRAEEWVRGMVLDEIVVMSSLLAYGIYVAPPLRLFLNIGFDEERDLSFLEERLPYALRDARAEIERRPASSL